MDDFTNYAAYAEDRIVLDHDADKGPGASKMLIYRISKKHGWSFKQFIEWYSQGEIKAEDIVRFEVTELPRTLDPEKN